MKNNIILLLILGLCIQTGFSQSFSRKQFDYSQMEEKAFQPCEESILEELDYALSLLDSRQSEVSVNAAQSTYTKNNGCPQVYVVYAWSLFRNGRWQESWEVIENGIEKFGPYSDLIRRRAYMSIEMADLGTGQRNIDGNTVYLAKNKHLPYNEDSFKEENYKSALADFEFLSNYYNEMYDEIMMTGYIYQQLKQYQKSNEYLTRLLAIEEYKDQALVAIVDNYLEQKQVDSAAFILLDLEKKNPRNVTIQGKLYALYDLKGEKEKMTACKEKQYFYQVTPSLSSLPYTKENFETIIYFADDKKAKDKAKKLKKIIKEREQSHSIDVCLSILKMHLNHGNGLEEKAAAELIKIGKPAVPQVVALLENDEVSTCTVTNLAEILATIKDPAGWEPLVNYLPRMANLPFTVIPPNVPEKIIQFDKEKGARILIEFVKPMIQQEQIAGKSGNPLDNIPGFGNSLFYTALKDLKKEDITRIAKEFSYSEVELSALLAKVYN